MFIHILVSCDIKSNDDLTGLELIKAQSGLKLISTEDPNSMLYLNVTNNRPSKKDVSVASLGGIAGNATTSFFLY